VTLRVPTVVVISGAEIGAGYVRQLLRAAAAGRLETDRILVVDRDPRCAAGRFQDSRVRIETAEWDVWLDAHLDRLGADDQLVPYHWAPHLLVGWLERALARTGARVERGGEIPARGLPFEQPTRDGDRALSYATWVCPPTCIEPVLCPHTRGPKDWSLVSDLAACRSTDPFDGTVVFPSLHLVYGVGTIPIRDILATRARLSVATAGGSRRYLVSTSSHCHALASVLTVTSGSAAPRRV
jgi:hypothetical protein